jgi:hypothetical protein
MMDVPPDPPGMDSDAEDELDDEDEDQNFDDRYTTHRRDRMIADEDGYVSDSDDEDELLRRENRRDRMDYRESTSSFAKGKALIVDSDEDTEEDIDEEIEENGVDEEDTTGLEIEVEVPTAVENGAMIPDSESDGEVTDEEPADEATLPSPSTGKSARPTPARSETSELQGDTVMVDVPQTANNITT